jgi:hypothetical protein
LTLRVKFWDRVQTLILGTHSEWLRLRVKFWDRVQTLSLGTHSERLRVKVWNMVSLSLHNWDKQATFESRVMSHGITAICHPSPQHPRKTQAHLIVIATTVHNTLEKPKPS